MLLFHMGELTCLVLFFAVCKKRLKNRKQAERFAHVDMGNYIPPPSIFFKLYNQKWPEHFLFLSIL